VLVWVDVAFCMALMLVGSRAAPPAERNKMMTELVPFSLASPAGLGVGAGLTLGAVLAVVGLMAAWSVAVLPDVSLKLGSDLLGFLLWYIVAMLITRELRTLSHATEAAQRAAAESHRIAAEQERQAETARLREIAHREIHDYLLPVVDHVATGGPATPSLALAARRGAERARRVIMDPRGAGVPSPGFESLMTELRDAFADEGLPLVAFIAIDADPPAEVAEAVAAATREALRNVLKHAGSLDSVSLFVESGSAGLEVVVRDRGVGFDPASAPAGGGLAGTYAALRRHGGECTAASRPGDGVKVTIRWPAGPAGPTGG
jgi:signal transduction histidine kinase